jgi:glycosyltransferase involved in cell wall biosynthesis
MNENQAVGLASPSARGDAGGRLPLRLLVLARNYPNPELPLLGLWTQRLVQCVTGSVEAKVVSPVPYAPPLPALGSLDYYGRHRRVPRRRWDGPVEVFHPRMLIGPGSSTRVLEALAYALAAVPAVRRLRREFPFDLIHAHFTYPDGVVARLLGRRYGVPVVITEHAPWLPWMDEAPLIRRQAVWAARTCDAHIPVSSYVRRTLLEVMDGRARPTEPIPMLVDGETFKPSGTGRKQPPQILFVGAVRRAKGADVLIEALAQLRRTHPEVRLVLAGEPFYRSYARDFEQILERVRELGLERCVDVVGPKPPPEIARLMSESALLVVPGRAESFSAVAIEALACGTPVVATRCGGPEEIVTPELGRLVPREDPVALAEAMGDVLDEPQRYPPQALRRLVLGRFGADVVAAETVRRYLQACYGGR